MTLARLVEAAVVAATERALVHWLAGGGAADGGAAAEDPGGDRGDGEEPHAGGARRPPAPGPRLLSTRPGYPGIPSGEPSVTCRTTLIS